MAVVALSESWAGELQKEGIAVSVLCPAFVRTRIHESHRNRQEIYRSEILSKRSAGRAADKTRRSVENGIAPAIVGKRVVEALNVGELYIFTHPNYRSLLQNRAKKIDEAFERAAQSPLLQHIVNQQIDVL
jgi:short-subunit dehydrogenase